MKKGKFVLLSVLIVVVAGIAAAANYSTWFRGLILAEELPDARVEYRKIIENLLQRDSAINLEGTILLYDGEEKSTVKENNDFRLFRKADQLYSRLAYLETFCDGKYMVQLDTVEQVIVVAKAGDIPELSSRGTRPALDLLFKDTAAFRIVGQSAKPGQNRKISLQTDLDPRIRLYTISYDPNTYQIRNAEIEWWKNEFDFENTDTTKVWITNIDYRYPAARDLNVPEMMSKVVQVNQDKAEPANQYKYYRLNVAF